MLDWPRLLAQHGVPFKEQRNEVYVQCPFCGKADQGTHMGISLRGRGWGCFRQAKHRGKSDVRLIAALLKLDFARAAALVGRPLAGLAPDEDLAASVRRRLSPEPAEARRTALDWPPGVKPLSGGPKTREKAIFYDYLAGRGYSPKALETLCECYGLHYAMTGPFAYRLLLPIDDAEGRLVTWTGRTVSQHTLPRYLTLSPHAGSKLAADGMPLALAPITDMLWQEARLFQVPRRTLIVCEGPFDAMRVDYANRRDDVMATCLFGKTLSQAQYDKLCTLAEYCEHKFIMLDPDAKLDTFALSDKLFSLGFHPIDLPEKYEDAGDARLTLATLRYIVAEEIDKWQSP